MKRVHTYLAELKEAIDHIPMERVDAVIEILQEARLNHKHVFILGNGGSASTASHFVCDLAKNTRKNGWPEFRVIGLTDNMAIFSAYANDEGYEKVFSQQLRNLMQAGDVVIAISGSGNSINVVEAVEFANAHGGITIGFTGLTGGKLKNLAQHVIYVPCNRIDQVEDIHLILEHMITRTFMEMDEISVRIEQDVVHPAESVELLQESDGLVREFFGNALPLI